MIQNWLQVGKIVGSHGIHGAVRVQPWCDGAEVFRSFSVLYLEESDSSPLTISHASAHGNVALLQFDGVDTVEKAEALRGKILFCRREQLALREGQYLILELIGCRVFDEKDDTYLGEICDVTKTGANDVWHIRHNGNVYLIPAIESVLKEVNVADSVVKIHVLEGIFDDEN